MNDILKSINLRLGNPFILSFCISWIFWNWPIVVGLIWYNSTTIEKFGYANFKHLINENGVFWRNYIMPIVFAILYPFAKWGLSWFQVWLGTKEEKTIKEVSGKGFVPTSKYLAVIDNYDADIKKLSDIIAKEGELQAEKIQLEVKLAAFGAKELEFDKEKIATTTWISNLNIGSSLNAFIGIRRLIMRDSFGIIYDHRMNFSAEAGFIINENPIAAISYGTADLYILSYICNPFTKKAYIVLKILSLNKEYTFSNCEWDDNFNKLTGKAILNEGELTFEISNG